MAEYLEANTLLTLYGDAKDSKQRANWTTNYSNYDPKKLIGDAPANLNMINQMSGDLLDIYSAELSSLGLSSDKFMDAIRRVAFAESSLQSNQESKTGVVGLMQVTSATARDLMKQGIVGSKAQKYLGISEDINDKDLRELLKTPKGSVVFGAGKITQAGMKYRNDQKKINIQPVDNSKFISADPYFNGR